MRTRVGAKAAHGAVLVIALIMLAVVTFIVTAYLAFAQRERTSINMSIIQTETRFILDTGTAWAQAEVAKKIMGGENYQMFVSQNVDGANVNVPSIYNSASLKELKDQARAPVYYNHDRKGPHDEFRYFLDLNRDAGFQATGLSDVGDPHWIGVLEDPDLKHGAKLPNGRRNRFIGRYAYMVVPASKALDINNIHNWSKRIQGEGFWRPGNAAELNPAGIGVKRSGQLNMAGTLAAVRASKDQGWNYELYRHVLDQRSRGSAFDGAASLWNFQDKAGKFYDVFDLYTPVRAGPRQPPKGVNHFQFTRTLETAGNYAFYDFARSVGTHEQEVPGGKLNLNDYQSLAANLANIDLLTGEITTEVPHKFPPGARLCLYSDTGIVPSFRRPVGDGSFKVDLVRPHDVFFAKPMDDAPDMLRLYHEYVPLSAGSEAVFSGPVEFVNIQAAEMWRPGARYAQNDVVLVPGTAERIMALKDHVATTDIAGDLASYWAPISQWPATQYRLDRSLEMFEEVAARLLEQRATAPDRAISPGVVIRPQGTRPIFDIKIHPLKTRTEDELNIYLENLDAVFNNPAARADFDEYTREYSPEIQRLLQLAANIVDMYSPGPQPSVFRPYYDRTTKGVFMRGFIREPHRSFLAQVNKRVLPEDAASLGPLDLITRVKLYGEAWSVPLVIGAKKRWPDQQGRAHIPAALNEVSLQCMMHLDPESQSIRPSMRVAMEIKDASKQGGVVVHGAVSASGTIRRYPSSGLGLGGVQNSFNYVAKGSVPEVARLLPQNSGLTVQSQIHVPLEYGDDFASQLQQTLAGTNVVEFFGDFGPRTWEVRGEVDVSCALATPDLPDGRKGLLLDHAELQFEFNGGRTPFNESWTNPKIYKQNDIVYYGGEGYVYHAAAESESGSDDQVDVEIGTRPDGSKITRKILDPSRWAMLNWSWNEARKTHPPVYPEGAVIKATGVNAAGDPITQFYTAKRPFAPGGDLASNAAAGLIELYGGEFCEFSWQVNDPLVNGHLMDYRKYNHAKPGVNPDPATGEEVAVANVNFPPITMAGPPRLGLNMGRENLCWQPWSASLDQPRVMTYKDPGVSSSAFWDFPVVGYDAPLRRLGDLGRVHRGTPWQTVYLKAPPPPKWGDGQNPEQVDWDADPEVIPNTGGEKRTPHFMAKDSDGNDIYIDYIDIWREWVLTRWQRGILDGNGNDGKTALNSRNLWFKIHPTRPESDWALLESFTVGDDTRGLLSINQTASAAWAAALAGVEILPGHVDGGHVRPGDGRMSKIVSGINKYRASKRGKMPYALVSEILEVPELSLNSPYLPTVPSEWHCEAIPRQVLSLLRVEYDFKNDLEEKPRFIAYVFSQALRPAPQSIVRNGPDKGLCTNYQVVGEAAARTEFSLSGAESWAKMHESGFGMSSALLVGGGKPAAMAGGFGGLTGTGLAGLGALGGAAGGLPGGGGGVPGGSTAIGSGLSSAGLSGLLNGLLGGNANLNALLAGLGGGGNLSELNSNSLLSGMNMNAGNLGNLGNLLGGLNFGSLNSGMAGGGNLGGLNLNGMNISGLNLGGVGLGRGGAGGLNLLGGLGLGGAAGKSTMPPPRVVIENYAPMFVR